MALNRYRLRHLADRKHRGAILAQRLLETPDRLIGLILLGNNAVNILAASIATVIGLRLYQEAGIAIASGLLTLIILIYSEVGPKTVAALYPERIAFPAAYVLTPLLKILSPLVLLINLVTNKQLGWLGIPTKILNRNTLSQEELRTVVLEAGSMIPRSHQEMLLGILDLEKATVEDIMIPRNEIDAIDLKDPWEEVMTQLIYSKHTRLPVYEDNPDQILGFTHLRKLISHLKHDTLTEKILRESLQSPYFIPVNTTLNNQLVNFRKEKQRVALTVDEYGSIQGLVALEDILEEIVGDVQTGPIGMIQDIFPQEDGSYMINASATIRELRRALNWDLPYNGPKTLNGLILEHMESIPPVGTSFMLGGHPVEILHIHKNAVKTVKLTMKKPKKGN